MARTLVKALENGEETLARDIIQNGSYSNKDSNSSKTIDTALFFCCSRGFLELAKLLLHKGASVSFLGKNQAIPLHAAVDNGHLDVVRLLIDHGSDVNAKNVRGDTPLHLAAYRGYGHIVQCLMESGADCRLVNGNSFTAENEAFVHGHRDLGCYLRLEHSVRYPSQSGNCNQSFNSMIPLDCPSVIVKPGSSSHQPENQTQKRQSGDTDTKKHNSLLFLPLDPPTDSSPALYSLRRHNSYLNKEHTTGASTSLLDMDTFIPDSTLYSLRYHNSYLNEEHTTGVSHSFSDMNGSAQESPSISSYYTFSLIPEMTSDCVADLTHVNSMWQTDSLSINNHIFTLNAQHHNSAFESICKYNQRRPSTGSNSSFFSDISCDTGSDAHSLLSNGSDASLNFCEYRREDLDFQDNKLGNTCPDTSADVEDDFLFHSLGVRNPPNHKFEIDHLTKLKTTGPPERDNDSTLFSLRSLKYGNTPASESCKLTPNTSDLILSDRREDWTTVDNFDKRDLTQITHSSESSSCSSSNKMFKACPDYETFGPTNLRSNNSDIRNFESKIFPCMNRLSSNELSSLTEKSSITMTRVNIPLVSEK